VSDINHDDATLKLGYIDRRFIWWVIISLFFMRVFFIFQMPYTDTTEARYAEIARKMVETNDWITPQFDYGVPFWGKPPLHTWVSAAGMKIFGVNHFGGRIFIFLCCLGLLTILYRWVREQRGGDYALAGTLVLASSVLFIASSAMVMTDLIMTFGTSLAMLGYWKAMKRTSGFKFWGYMFFVGLAIGLLAKGPLAVVIAAISIGGWVIATNRWKATWQNLPWVSGSILMLLLTLPWYIAAEAKTPGFLEYFIFGEHIERFLKSGWQGDLYGSGHAKARGTIWLYWILMMLPWTPFFLITLPRFGSIIQTMKLQSDGWALYLFCWAIAPLLFFTMATNIIATYVISGVPACAFLIIEAWSISRQNKMTGDQGLGKFYRWTALSSVVILATGCYLFCFQNPIAMPKTQKWLAERIFEKQPEKGARIYSWKKRCYSLEFYTKGQVQVLNNTAELVTILNSPHRDFISIRVGYLNKLPKEISHNFEIIDTFGLYSLLYEKSNTNHINTDAK
jgi:4-amino-4-deoxy-L-arabinose transferase-like glycosyltransferase